jgi:hypothetical protein
MTSARHVGVSAVQAEKPDRLAERSTPPTVVASRDVTDSPHGGPAHALRSVQEPVAAPPLALAPNSDLVMVETRFAAPVVDTEPPVAPRPRRERRPSASVPDEPLQMVETRKDQPSA